MRIQESGRPGDPKPSPQTLNASLNMIYKNLPMTGMDLNEASGRNLGVRLARGVQASRSRRRSSSYKELFLLKATETIEKSYLSGTGKKTLVGILDATYDSGFDDKTKKATDPELGLLQIGESDSGGIFDEMLAPELECAWYRHTANASKNWSQVIQGYLEEFRNSNSETISNMTDDQKKLFMENVAHFLLEFMEISKKDTTQVPDREKDLQAWREDIIRTHHIDPEDPTLTPQEAD